MNRNILYLIYKNEILYKMRQHVLYENRGKQ